MPSWGALIRHFKRALYILKLPFSAPFAGCSVLTNVDEYGWKLTDEGGGGGGGGVEVDWDDSAIETMLSLKGKGCHGQQLKVIALTCCVYGPHTSVYYFSH